MTIEVRPVCVYALAGLKRNANRLMIVMCIGIALALYGVYVQARSQTNPQYMPTISVASNWLYDTVGQRLLHPLNGGGAGCQKARQAFKPTVGQLIMYRFIYPVMRQSGVLNGLVNVGQLVVLRLNAKSITGTDAIIGLSAFGLFVSMLCLVGSFASCKLMCVSCLGIHHVVIVYLALRRRRILKNILCPSSAASSAQCTYPGDGGSSSSPKSNAGTTPTKPASTYNSGNSSAARRRPDSERRRSDRN